MTLAVGVIFPQTEIGTDPGDIRRFARASEDLGFTHLAAFDHVLGAVHADREPPLTHWYDEGTEFHEPLTLFAHLGAITSSIEFATQVLVLPQRQTALVAKQAAQVSLLCDGRLRLGVGTGWNWVEYEALGLPFEDRGARLTEQVELMRALWADGVVSFTGDHHTVDRATIRPLPPKTVPVWFGGATDRALRRGARIGDGFVFADPDAYARVPVLQRMLVRADRNPATFGIEGRIAYGRGAPDDWRRAMDHWRTAGATHVALSTLSPGLLTPDDHLRAIERFADVAL